MNVKLFEIQQQGNKYCGPAVISALTGLATNQCAAIIRETSGRQTAVKGTSDRQMTQTLSRLGFRMTVQTPVEKSNLRTWVKANAKGTDVYLVISGNHFILVRGKYAMCGVSKDLTPIDEHPYARTFVKCVYLLTKKNHVEPETLVPYEVRTSTKNAETSARVKAKKLAVKIGCEVEVDKYTDNRTIWVYKPEGIALKDDPFERDGHFCDDWVEALNRVQTYHDMLFPA